MIKRFMNLLVILFALMAIIALLHFDHSGVGSLLFLFLITCVFGANYVIFGEATLWHSNIDVE